MSSPRGHLVLPAAAAPANLAGHQGVPADPCPSQGPPELQHGQGGHICASLTTEPGDQWPRRKNKPCQEEQPLLG